MALAIPLFTLAGGALAAYGSIAQGQAQKTASQYNAQLNLRNATVASQQADANIAQLRRNVRQVQGAAVAGYGASGVTQEGSPLDVLEMSTTQASLDEGTIRYKGQLESMGYHSNAILDNIAGKTAEQQGYLTGASHLLTSIGRAGSDYAYASGKGADRTTSPNVQLND